MISFAGMVYRVPLNITDVFSFISVIPVNVQPSPRSSQYTVVVGGTTVNVFTKTSLISIDFLALTIS